MGTANRILIVDDHALFRGVLREFLSQEPDFQIVGEAANMREAIGSIGTLAPHLVLTDLAMSDAHGIEAVTEIKRHHPDIKVLVVSSYSEIEFERRCRLAGAVGYIVKHTIQDDLCDSIRAVLGAKAHIGARAPYEALQNCLVDLSAPEEVPINLLH